MELLKGQAHELPELSAGGDKLPELPASGDELPELPAGGDDLPELPAGGVQLPPPSVHLSAEATEHLTIVFLPGCISRTSGNIAKKKMNYSYSSKSAK